MVHVAVNKYDFEKINILEYAFGDGGGGHQKAYAVYAFINVDNCERPLTHSKNVTTSINCRKKTFTKSFGGHVAMKCPFRSGSRYYNYKGFFSVILLSIRFGGRKLQIYLG